MARKIWVTVSLLLLINHSGWPQTLSNNNLIIDSVVRITNNILKPETIDHAKTLIDSLINLASQKQTHDNVLIQLKIKNLLGKYLLLKQEYNGFIDLYHWCQNMESLCRSEEELDLLVRLYNNAGIAFKRMNQLQDSEEAYLKATEVLKKIRTPDYYLHGSIYANAGNALRIVSEFERSIEYLKQGIAYFDEYAESKNHLDDFQHIAEPKSKALNNLGLVYQCLSDHKQAIQTFEKCIDLKSKFCPENITEVYGNLVISLIEEDNLHDGKQINELQEAKHYLNLILESYRGGLPIDRSWALAKVNQSDVNFRLSGDVNRLIREIDQINIVILNTIPAAKDITVVANQLIINILIKQKKYSDAISKWSETMKSLSSVNGTTDPIMLSQKIKDLNFNKLIELMNLNAYANYCWGVQNADIRKLKESEHRYTQSLQLIDSLRNSLELQSSKMQVSKMQRSTYNYLIELDYKIFESTGDSTYIDKIFSIMEQSKSAGLWSSVRDVEFKNDLIPATLLKKEKDIQKKISDIESQIIEANANPENDDKKIRALQQENSFYKLQMDSLKVLYRQTYPDYYKAKFDQSTISLSQVRSLLKPGQVLLEYAFAFNYLYILSISPNGRNIDKMLLQKEAKQDISFVLDFVKGRSESLTSRARTSYCESASRLYNLLIPSRIAQSTQSNMLLIVPDSSLCYMPFEALLKPQPDKYKPDYRKLPYLIHDYTVSYGLTATIFYNKPTRVSTPSKCILAVAPRYDFSRAGISDYLKQSADGLPDLTGTVQESRAIKRMLGGRLLAGDQATEAKFKSLGPHYGILHLAMHSITDKTNSMNSGLVFTPGADRHEDGILFGHEVYNLSLNAWLTVLSACETGSGQMASGEGVLSFGRAFIYAGCPNLIMTLWTVDDRSSEDIVESFYQSLQAGSGVADALRNSKLSYLAKADKLHAHPHYWAGFIELGQNHQLPIMRKNTGLIYLSLIFSLTVISLILLQVKKNPRRSRDIMEK